MRERAVPTLMVAIMMRQVFYAKRSEGAGSHVD